MAKEIDIKLKTTYDGKGGDKAKKHLKGIADGFAKSCNGDPAPSIG